MMNVKVIVYDKCKYYNDSKKVAEVEYRNIRGFKVVSDIIEVSGIEAETDESGIDEYHEYLIITLENGETSTFRNSNVDMFRI